MHYRALIFAVSSTTCLLAACSGGGSSPSAGPAPSSASATPVPTVAPTARSTASPVATGAPTAAPTATVVPATYPYANGNTFVYTGTLAQSYQSFPEIVPPGTPSPEPIATTSTTVTQRIGVVTGETFDGTSGLVDLHNAETDALSSGLETTTSTTDTYVGTVATAALTQLLGYGSNDVDEAGDTVSTVPASATILDELPETPGATWSNGPAGTIDESIAGDASGSAITVVRSTNADGTYTEKTTYPPGYSAIGITGVGIVQENADGSGSLAIEANGGPTTITYSPPEPQASGPPLITINVYDSLDTTGTPAGTSTLASWYGTTPALYSETDRDDGVTTVPAACGISSSIPSQATELQQTIARTDTILGYVETTTTTNYVAAGYGLVCTTLADKQTLIYDFNGDEPFAFTVDPPLEIVTASEVLGLQPNSTIAQPAATRRAFAVPASALRARFDRTLRAARERRLLSFVRRLESRRRLEGAR